MRTIINIKYEGKNYPMIISESDDPKDIEYGAIHIECKAAGLNQGILKEDLSGFILAMPELIEAKRDIDKEVSKKDEVFRLRMTKEEKTQLERLAKSNGFKTISSYIRAKAFINA